MISISSLYKSFGSLRVLNGLNLEIRTGEILAVIGPAGAGKSVLLKHLVGLLRPDSGKVVVDGEDIGRLSRRELNRVREKFGMLFQHPALFDPLTVFENLAFPLKEKGKLGASEIEHRVHEALAQVGLGGVEAKYQDQLSGGTRKRVGLARALLMDPVIILFDEPTGGLDPVLGRAMHHLIKQTHQRFGYTAVLVSPEISALPELADRIALLYRGAILQVGTPVEILSSENPLVRRLIGGSEAGLPDPSRD